MKSLSILVGCCLWISLSCWCPAKAELTDVVQTDKGPIRGEILETIMGAKKYSSFSRVPFAKPPINELRFRPPVEADPWRDVLNATAEPPQCLQNHIISGNLVGNEDCLYLNVYTPKTKLVGVQNKRPLAVMVLVFGGQYRTGRMDRLFYGPDFFIDENVVMVTINYRLGPLGFLSLNHPNATGNMGLKDQGKTETTRTPFFNFISIIHEEINLLFCETVLALKWVQKNIQNFGGDPRKVTIFGISTGGGAVSLHRVSKASAGLFSASISMSGSSLCPWGYHSTESAVSKAFALGRKLGLKSWSKDKLLELLLSTPPEVLIQVSAAQPANRPRSIIFKPTIEDEKIAVDPFLTECPFYSFKAGRFARKPAILGFVESETLTLRQKDNPAVTETMVLMRTMLDVSLEETDEIVNITTAGFLFTAGIDQEQRYISQRGVPVYYYKNSFDHSTSYHRLIGFNFNGTDHADDILHLFYARSLYGDSGVGLTDNKLNQHRWKMIRMWTNFAKFFNPTPTFCGKLDPLTNVMWLPSGPTGRHLELGKAGLKMKNTRPITSIVREWQIIDELSDGSPNGYHIA